MNQEDLHPNRTAPVIKLPEGATEDDHLALLGLLNSSTACFWMKQVFHCKGLRGQGGGITSEEWEQFYEFDSTKLKPFPVVPGSDVVEFAGNLTAIASRRGAALASLLRDLDWTSAEHLRGALGRRRKEDMSLLLEATALQEELDWLSYRVYGLAPDAEVREIDDTLPQRPTQRPIEILLARDNPATAWFERHGWEPERDTDDPLVQRRLEMIKANKALRLIEQPMYKRRWYKPDYAAEEQAALGSWLLDRVESWSEARSTPWTAQDAAAALQQDKALLSVLEVLTDRRDFDLATELGKRVDGESVPNNKHHRYKDSGLKKRAAWEHTWALQHREDAGEAVAPPVPPKYTGSDFLKPAYYKLRGKLDVPKERFIAFTEVPDRPAAETLYAWAGWTPRQRAKALLDRDERLGRRRRPPRGPLRRPVRRLDAAPLRRLGVQGGRRRAPLRPHDGGRHPRRHRRHARPVGHPLVHPSRQARVGGHGVIPPFHRARDRRRQDRPSRII